MFHFCHIKLVFQDYVPFIFTWKEKKSDCFKMWNDIFQKDSDFFLQFKLSSFISYQRILIISFLKWFLKQFILKLIRYFFADVKDKST